MAGRGNLPFFLVITHFKRNLSDKTMEHIPAGPVFHKPMSIIAAKNILYATLFLGVINWVIGQWGMDGRPNAPVAGAVVLILTLVVVFLLIRQIGLGRKWARMVLLILFVAGLLMSPWTLPVLFKTNFLVGVLSVLQALLQLVALIFLFSRSSSQWFERVQSNAHNEPAQAHKH